MQKGKKTTDLKALPSSAISARWCRTEGD